MDIKNFFFKFECRKALLKEHPFREHMLKAVMLKFKRNTEQDRALDIMMT